MALLDLMVDDASHDSHVQVELGRALSEVPSDADHKHWQCFSLAGRAVLSDSAALKQRVGRLLCWR